MPSRLRTFWTPWALALTQLTAVAAVAPARVGPAAPPAAAAAAPFTWADFTWLNGHTKQRTFPLPAAPGLSISTYMDTYYALSTHLPRDNTLTGSTSIGRSNELQLNLASVGLHFSHAQVSGR